MGVKKIIAVFDYVDFAIAWFHMFIMNITHQDVCIDSCLCDNKISENGREDTNTIYIYLYTSYVYLENILYAHNFSIHHCIAHCYCFHYVTLSH